MVKDGYQPLPFSRQNTVAPEADWNHRYEDEWVFEYTRRGFESAFVLHCSLQAATGKMFVQGREKESSTRMHNLGLQVEKYIPSAERCKRPSWEGVLDSQEALEEMFLQYIAEPLRRNATPSKKAAGVYDKTTEWLHRQRGALQHRDAVPAVAISIAALLVAAAAVYMYRSHAGGPRGPA